MDIIALKPQSLWRAFKELNTIPRTSKKEQQATTFIKNLGESLGLKTIVDRKGNVIIKKPSTTGMENRPTVILQSHLDMVHQKNTDIVFDFTTQGISMYVDGDWVKAQGTTLGADNGIGVAAIIAILLAKDLLHPPIEALFTTDEEDGMGGAKHLDVRPLLGRILLNLDTEYDDELTLGCAGGVYTMIKGKYQEKKINNGTTYRLAVKGLQGGHSGMDIHLGRGNANKLMNRLLYDLFEACPIRIVEISGGDLLNTIPRESFAVIYISKKNEKTFLKKFTNVAEEIQNEWKGKEPVLQVSHELLEKNLNKAMCKADQKKLLQAIYACHNGVLSMSNSIEGLVETSSNLAKVVVKKGQIQIRTFQRSAIASAKWDMAKTVRTAFESIGLKTSYEASYPGWQPNMKSPLLQLMIDQYKNLFKFKEEPKISATHGGLECGFLKEHMPEVDMISFGPTIKGAHSPDERVSITSVQKFWKYLTEVLRNIPENINPNDNENLRVLNSIDPPTTGNSITKRRKSNP
ncbi:MAG: aminoacyl-histidine dipeptidase [Flavobacteriales bacterium]